MPQLIYESEGARVVLGDARDVLGEMPVKSADVVVVDPPYGVEWQSNRRAERFDALAGDGEDEREGVRAIIAECVRVLGQNRHLYVFGPPDVLEGQKATKPTPLVWEKGTNGSGNVSSPWSPSHELLHFAINKTQHGGEAGTDGGVPARLRRGSVLRYTRPTGRNVRHPTEKPWPLLAELIESSSRAGELVVDPCAGIGSTGVAAVLRGRCVLLVEINEEYARLAAERLRQAERLRDEMAAI